MLPCSVDLAQIADLYGGSGLYSLLFAELVCFDGPVDLRMGGLTQRDMIYVRLARKPVNIDPSKQHMLKDSTEMPKMVQNGFVHVQAQQEK